MRKRQADPAQEPPATRYMSTLREVYDAGVVPAGLAPAARRHVLGAEVAYQRLQLVRSKHDCIEEDLLQVARRRLWQRRMAVGARAPGMIDAAGISAEISATMDGENFQLRMTL